MSKVFMVAIHINDGDLIAEKLTVLTDLIKHKEMAGDTLNCCGYYNQHDFSYHTQLVTVSYGGPRQPLLENYEH
jgi:hypothetical protein